MKTITVSKAKAQFSGIARRVVKTKEPVTISTPAGLVQLIPWDLPAVVEPFTPGKIHMTDEEMRLANTLGETFGEETP
jgi:prevent-host-death family protein